MVGIILCLNAAAKISHRAQGIGAIASRWHALMTCSATEASLMLTSSSMGNLDAANKLGSFHIDYSESDLESVDFITPPTNIQLASYMSSYHKRLALGTIHHLPKLVSIISPSPRPLLAKLSMLNNICLQ